VCTCDDGFTGDGTTCTADNPDDPCAGDTDCAVDATCIPTEEGYTCECNPGLVGDGTSCTAPNPSCGDLTFEGECNGATLRYCGDEGPVEVDCSAGQDANGQPLACHLVSSDYGYDCIEASFTGGCGDISAEGSCADAVLSYCESQESGNVVTVACADDGLVCVVTEGTADCVPAGASGCGNVTASGTCDGATAVYCQDYAVVSQDCGATGEVCGRSDADFRCVAPSVASGSSTVTGSFVFEKKTLSQGGLGAVTTKPVRGALVTVRLASDDSKIAQDYTGLDGSFTISFEAFGDVYVLVTAEGKPGVHNQSVRDCPMEDCGGIGNIYGAASAPFTPAAASDIGETKITVARGVAGAFNIFDLYSNGADFAKANFGRYPPALNVQWKAGSNTPGGTSYFSGSEATISILGTPDDTDEFDDPVLLHEYGHYLEFYLSHSDSPGGSHDGSPTDPRLAWGEGYGTYVGCAIAGGPIYIDTSAAGATVTDIRIAGNDFLASLDEPKGMRQLVSEFLISQILWTISTGPNGEGGKGDGPTFDVLANYFTALASPNQGRGVEGVELVDFLDGWFCKGHGDKPFIESIVTGTAKFPYDYDGPASCN